MSTVWRPGKKRQSAKLRALRAFLFYVPLALRALAPCVPRAQRASHLTCPRTSRALVPYVPRALSAFCLTCLVPNVLSCLTCLTCSCISGVLCLACSRAASNSMCSFAPRPSLASGVLSVTCSYVSHVL